MFSGSSAKNDSSIRREQLKGHSNLWQPVFLICVPVLALQMRWPWPLPLRCWKIPTGHTQICRERAKNPLGPCVCSHTLLLQQLGSLQVQIQITIIKPVDFPTPNLVQKRFFCVVLAIIESVLLSHSGVELRTWDRVVTLSVWHCDLTVSDQ